MEIREQAANMQSRVVETVRENPVPLALMGLGLGWWALSTLRGGGGGGEERLGYGAPSGTYGPPPGYAGYGAGGETAPEYYGESYGEPYGQRTERMTERVGQWGRRASETAEEARNRARRMASSTTRQISEASRNVRHQASQFADRSYHTFQEHPLMVGSMALLIGMAIGAALPLTRREGRVMGGSAGGIWERAKHTGEEQWEKAKRVASRSAEVAGQEMREGYEHVRETAKDEAERQGLGEMGPGEGRLPH